MVCSQANTFIYACTYELIPEFLAALSRRPRRSECCRGQIQSARVALNWSDLAVIVRWSEDDAERQHEPEQAPEADGMEMLQMGGFRTPREHILAV